MVLTSKFSLCEKVGEWSCFKIFLFWIFLLIQLKLTFTNTKFKVEFYWVLPFTPGTLKWLYIHTYIHIYIYIHVHIWFCVCVFIFFAVVLVMSNCLRPHELSPARLFCPKDFPGRILERVAISFSRGFPQPRDQTHVSALASGFFTTEPPRKPMCVNIYTYMCLCIICVLYVCVCVCVCFVQKNC